MARDIQPSFWAARCKEVTRVEHHPDWHEKISKLAPMNARIILAAITQKEDEYHPTPETREQFRRYAEAKRDLGIFDVLVIDGYAKSRVRYQCAQSSLPQLAGNGMIILDNSDWLPATARCLMQAGLIEVDFSGQVPGNEYCQTTSLFFRREFDV